MTGVGAPAAPAGPAEADVVTAEADVVRVLLVEDDDAHAALERRLFERASVGRFAVDRVASGAAALARSAHSAYDAVVADYRLGDVDGLALAARLRQAGVRAPVVLLTGHGSEAVAAGALRAGVAEYVPKQDGLRDGRLPRAVLEVVDRQRVAQALRAQEEWFHALIEQGSDAVVVLAADGTITYASPATARLLGYAPGEYVGRSAFEFVHPDDRPHTQALLGQLVQTPGGSVAAECRARHRDGSWRWLEATGINLLAEPSVRAIAVSYRDITERKEAEEARAQLLERERRARAAAEAAVRGREEVLAVAAHELRTPVTVLWGRVQRARRTLGRPAAPDPARALQQLQELDEQARKLNRLVDQLLDVSRIGAGKLALEPAPTDLRRLVDAVVAAARVTAKKHRLAARGRVATRVLVDPLRLEQVLVNLLNNAVKHSPEGGRIEVELAQPSPDTVRLAVRDYGDGIPPEHRARIFERFHQAHGEGHLRGLGLGLYVSRQIVEAHGGQLTAEFPEGGGTRFVVTLPAAAAEPA